MQGLTAVVLLLVALALLLLGASALRRRSGMTPSASQSVAMALMTGAALGFLALVFLGHPFMLFPLAIGVALLAGWARPARLALIGALLLGFGLLWAAMFGWQRLNDLADPAVSYPGWTPFPLAAGLALTVLGIVLLTMTPASSGGSK
jgi:hypothetical protein